MSLLTEPVHPLLLSFVVVPCVGRGGSDGGSDGGDGGEGATALRDERDFGGKGGGVLSGAAKTQAAAGLAWNRMLLEVDQHHPFVAPRLEC